MSNQFLKLQCLKSTLSHFVLGLDLKFDIGILTFTLSTALFGLGTSCLQ